MELREKIARALASADGKDPDAPAWVRMPGNETFGICWRDQYSAKADKILAIPEIRDALGLSYKGVKIVEDARLKPGEMKMVSPNP